MKSVAVVGAGVIGLTTAIRLRQAGYEVVVYSKDRLWSTTSANSGAIWGPFLSGHDARVGQWSYQTLEVLIQLAADPASGVIISYGTGAQDHSFEVPWWVETYTDSQPCEPPNGYQRAWRYSVPIVDMPRYLTFLARWLTSEGAHVLHEPIHDLEAIPSRFTHVVLAAGLGSAALVGDQLLSPSRGELLVVANPGLQEFFAERGDGPNLTYILPQGDKVILGGTAEPGAESLASDDRAAEGILERCARIEPRLRSVPVLSTRVGIRPCRDEIRLSHDASLGRHVVHNYGHGGSGVSVAWGCAESVVAMIAACDRPSARATKQTKPE